MEHIITRLWPIIIKDNYYTYSMCCWCEEEAGNGTWLQQKSVGTRLCPRPHERNLTTTDVSSESNNGSTSARFECESASSASFISWAAALCSGPSSPLNPFTQASLCFHDFADRDMEELRCRNPPHVLPFPEFFRLMWRYMQFQVSGQNKPECLVCGSFLNSMNIT